MACLLSATHRHFSWINSHGASHTHTHTQNVVGTIIVILQMGKLSLRAVRQPTRDLTTGKQWSQDANPVLNMDF